MAPDRRPFRDLEHPTAPNRRRFLQVGAASALGLALGACTTDDTAGPPPSSTTTASSPASSTTGDAAPATTTGGAGAAPTTPAATTALTVADFDGLATCVLLPAMTAGPYPLEEQFDRRDITEGYEGQPMRLGFRVVDDACTAVPGARVEIWHCDASGDYSAFTDNGGGKDEAEGTTFLRGTQAADADGIVEFLTVVPGWYRGRAVHIHLRVHVDDATVLTSQVFFDAGFLESVYAAAPYVEHGLPDTSNEDDGIAGDAEAEGTILVTTPGGTTNGAGTLALLNLGIDPAAADDGGDRGGPGRPGGPGGPRP